MTEVWMFAAFCAVVVVGLPCTYLVGRLHGAERATRIDLGEVACPSWSPPLLDGTSVHCMRHWGHPGWHEGPEVADGPPAKWIFNRPAQFGPRPTEEP